MIASPNIEVGIVSATSLKFHLGGKYEHNCGKSHFYGSCTAQLVDDEIRVSDEYGNS